MGYKFSTGSVRKGDIYFEDDRDGEPTYIDFGLDTITLRPSGSQILFVKSDAVGINTTAPDEILTINGVESQTDQTMIKFTEDGSDRALIGVNTSNNILIENLYSNKHIVFKASDAGVSREGLRLDGAVPEVVVNQTSDSLVDFRVESDNNTHMLYVSGGSDRVGIGTDAPDYTLDVAGDIGVNQYIYHNGDGNTWINFTDNRIRLNAGGNNFIDCEDPGNAPHKVRINNGGNNIDFVIKDSSNNVYFTADASTSRIGIGTDTPDHTLSVAGAVSASLNISASAFYGDGSNLTGISAGGGGSPAGSDTQIQFNDGGANFGASSNLTYDDTTLKVSSTGLNPIFSLEATNDGADASPVMTLKRTSTSPADADYLGQLKFLGMNDANQEVIYAKVTGKISDASDGTEDGIIEFANIKAGSQTITARLRSDSLQLLNGTNLSVDGTITGKMMHMTHHRYNDGSGTGKEYIPWAGTSEQPSPSYISMGVAPYNGRLVKVLVRSSKSGGLGSTVVGIHIGTDGTTTFNSTAEETVTVNMASANTTGTFSFTNSNHFAAGDTIAVSIDPTNAHGNVNVTCVWEYDIT